MQRKEEIKRQVGRKEKGQGSDQQMDRDTGGKKANNISEIIMKILFKALQFPHLLNHDPRSTDSGLLFICESLGGGGIGLAGHKGRQGSFGEGKGAISGSMWHEIE
ncbi:hypothetical protein EYF80_015117 [Liparis tanakae]|uniref:Uncharacterized protein n=1 Tax=Liparis tanakae TaxID=230148 RepID=A0A4Z2I9L5_9TELE|nr:hypothetical protein EYF80_015117 [Liparis tanakae]